MRAILTDRLAREGLRVKGTPLGIDDSAYGRLVEHPFEGEDAELASIVQRLVASCEGDVIRAADVDRLHLPCATGFSLERTTCDALVEAVLTMILVHAMLTRTRPGI